MGGDEESPPPSSAAPDSGLDQKDGFQETQQNGSGKGESCSMDSEPRTSRANDSSLPMFPQMQKGAMNTRSLKRALLETPNVALRCDSQHLFVQRARVHQH